MRLVDLSHDVEDGMVTYPGLPGPAITDHLSREASRERYAPGVEFHIGRIDMVANTGTYIDAPSHRYAAGDDLAGLALDRLALVPGMVVDATKAGPAIGPELFDPVAATGRAVLVRTGWDVLWRTEAYGGDTAPYLTAAAADLLVSAGAILVGIDSVNLDAMHDPARPAHSALLEAGIAVVEHLCALDQLDPAESFTFTAVPVKVRGMGTFPVRAFAAVG